MALYIYLDYFLEDCSFFSDKNIEKWRFTGFPFLIRFLLQVFTQIFHTNFSYKFFIQIFLHNFSFKIFHRIFQSKFWFNFPSKLSVELSLPTPLPLRRLQWLAVAVTLTFLSVTVLEI